jgi:hypothetical protein
LVVSSKTIASAFPFAAIFSFIVVANLVSQPAAAQAVNLQPTLQPATGSDDLLNLLSPQPMAQRSLREKPTRDYQGMPVEGWMLFPSLFVGGVYDDNIFSQSTNRVAGVGAKLRPALIAERDSGVQHTAIFLNGDFNIYPDKSSGNTVNAQAGFAHVWELQRDFVLRFGGEYDLLTNVYNNGIVIGPYGTAGEIASPQRSSRLGGYVSGVKSFNRFFVGLSLSSYATAYDTLDTTTGSLPQSYRDNLVTTATARLGYALSPVIYAFTDATGNLHNFSGDSIYGLIAPNVWSSGTLYNSQGYRLVAGLGTDRISLFKGEIYAGYQQQNYAYSGFGTHSSPVYGGKISWFPTRAWTLSLALDETYQDSGLQISGNTLGSAAFVTAATTTLQYALSRQWSASISGGYADVVYVSGGRRDQRWSAGATLNYEIARNILATAGYTLVLVESNAAGGSLTRNQFALGATYKY